jgi:asparagine synthase (glutamine-hydrolysing)
MAMANSVEGRFPYLDHRVIEFACRVPPRYRMKGLEEKFILKQVARNFIPTELVDRPKQPYRAPISQCFLGERPHDYVEELLSDSAIEKNGYFDRNKVSQLVAKCRRHQGRVLSERENMALAGILSTQLLDHLFLRNFPPFPVNEPINIRFFTQTGLNS